MIFLKYIAHRGVFSDKTKENTIESFYLAIKDNRFVGFELDIRVSKDNNFFVYHDYLLKGKPFKNYFTNELKDLNIPTLESVLNIGHNKIVLIEIKDFDIDVKKFLKLLDGYPDRKIYVMSFSNKVIEKIAKESKKYKLGILDYILNSDYNYKYSFICLLNSLIDEEVIRNYKNKNIEVMSYGIFKKQEIKFDGIYYIVDSDKI